MSINVFEWTKTCTFTSLSIHYQIFVVKWYNVFCLSPNIVNQINLMFSSFSSIVWKLSKDLGSSRAKGLLHMSFVFPYIIMNEIKC